MVVICIFVNIGMWFERFVITITSLSRDFVPSSWSYFYPTPVDVMMLIGSFGLVYHPVPVVLSIPSGNRHLRSQERDA